MEAEVLKKVLVGCSLLFLSACSQIPVQSPVTVKPGGQVSAEQSAWKQRQSILARKQRWSLNSKIALRYKEEHWSFGLNWQQNRLNQYVMQIKNPITGSVVAKLTKNRQGVFLLADDGKTYRDVDEERLLDRQSGVKLPLKGMQYWVRGLATPAFKTNKLILDKSGRPRTLYQAGWKIDYSRYTTANVDALPRKVVITRDKNNVYLKMIAKQWR